MKNSSLMRRIALALVCVLMLTCAAVASAAPAAGVVDVEEPIRATAEEVAEVDAANAPRVTTLDNGVQIQRTPFGDKNVYGRVVSSWNNLYLDADNRGCAACHTLEGAQDMMETFHGAIYMGYEQQYNVWTCFGCHGFENDTVFRDVIHSVHNRSDAFDTMNGSCDSCHYIDMEGEYLQWDFVKYDVLRGITDIAADSMAYDFSWNQTEITPVDKIFYKNPKNEPDEWLFYDEQITADIYENWTITVDGDVANPFEMSIDEMIEKFGTVTQVMKAHCVINGIGQPMIYQSEVTGIPMDKIIEYAQPNEDVKLVFPYGDDGYCYQISKDEALSLRSLIVLEIDGKPLPAGQGYPAAFWADKMSCGNFSKRVNKITLSASDGPSYALYGWVTDPDNNFEYFNKPNMGVLNAYDGQIFAVGEPIHLEGFADAWEEPIIRLEYSFDHGATWVEQPIENAVTEQWVYWTLDLNNEFAPGSYLIKMRATSLRADGTERTMLYTADYLFNVQ